MATDDADDLDRARAAIVAAFVAKRGGWDALTPADCARFDALADDYSRQVRRFEQELGLAPDDDGDASSTASPCPLRARPIPWLRCTCRMCAAAAKGGE